MVSLEVMKSSPTIKLLEQLDAPLVIARKVASQFEGIYNSGAVPIARFIEGMHKTLASETASVIAGLETVRAASFLADSPTQRAIEALKRDWDSTAQSMSLAREKWAMEAASSSRLIESWRRDLLRESVTLAVAWEPIKWPWESHTAQLWSTLKVSRIKNVHLEPAWATAAFLEKRELPRVSKIPRNNILSSRQLRNYRMAESYDLFTDFERGLRTFIHDAMCEAFGAGWEKSRVPNDMYAKWLEKRQTAKEAGESSEQLIDYADFTDYVIIIGRKDNWNEIFRPRFGRLQSVQESLFRLQPIRVCAMHSRILSQKMWLVLQTEIMLLSEKMWN